MSGATSFSCRPGGTNYGQQSQNASVRPLFNNDMDESSGGLEGRGARARRDLGEDEEGKPIKGAQTPLRPCRQEVEEHELCHIPFRNVCPLHAR